MFMKIILLGLRSSGECLGYKVMLLLQCNFSLENSLNTEPDTFTFTHHCMTFHTYLNFSFDKNNPAIKQKNSCTRCNFSDPT